MIKNYFFWALLIFFALQCLIEVFISRKNQRWIEQQGGIEFGKSHLKWVILLMIFFFLAIPIESFYFQTELVFYWPILFALFLFAQFLRYWSMWSLKRLWNVRIWVIPNGSRILDGPYRYLKHPNYLAVIIDLLVIPLMMKCYFTAFFSLIGYLIFLKTRIPAEEKALSLLHKS